MIGFIWLIKDIVKKVILHFREARKKENNNNEA